MSGQDPSGLESQKLEALARQLGDLEKQANELTAAIQRSASVRRVLVLVVVGVLAVFGGLYYQVGRSFVDQKNIDKMMVYLNKRAAANSQEVMNELQTLVKHTQPTVSDALEKQFTKDMPAILGLLGKEREVLALNLQDLLDQRLRAQYTKALKQHSAILQEEFDIQDVEALAMMVDHFEGGFQPLVKQYYGDRLKEEFNRMYATWDNFPLDNSRRTKEELEKELYHQLIGLMLQKVVTLATEVDPPKAAAGSSSGG